ncbi:MAG: LLM class flavin-dependent oxidoreductase, partial [Chloroflexi bacterium]|nr:LLM class flavin-dependent oxidoreductase [Chloroflexota bacterium]
RETSLRLGTGVTLVPVWHPLKLAYDTAMLDQLSGGRLILGVGLGNPPDWVRFGIRREELAQRMDEMLRALRALWSGKPGFQGNLIRIEGGIAPLPLQPGGPPLWVGGRTRRATQRAAWLGEGYYAATPYLFSFIQEQIERYHAALATLPVPKSPLVGVNRLTVLAEDDATARSEGRPYVESVLEKYVAINELAGLSADEVQGGSMTLLDRHNEQVCLVGSPATVLARVKQYAAIGVTDLQLRVAPGDMPAPLIERTIRLFGEKVLPQFREAPA